jgi:predicted nucleic acid-binding protein
MRLLDTNILSELVRPRPCPQVLVRLFDQHAGSLYGSELTRFELRRGACLRDDPEPLWQRLSDQVLPIVKWLPVDERISLRAGEISADLRRSGREAGVIDPFLAATAIVHGLLLVTRNVRHFSGIDGLTVENWFEDGR